MLPVITSVAAIVDILVRSRESLMQGLPPRAGLGRIDPWAFLNGNIAVKPVPIRLLAF
jgi:hypothetical protein